MTCVALKDPKPGNWQTNGRLKHTGAVPFPEACIFIIAVAIGIPDVVSLSTQ